jgi:hypothetical protein
MGSKASAFFLVDPFAAGQLSKQVDLRPNVFLLAHQPNGKSGIFLFSPCLCYAYDDLMRLRASLKDKGGGGCGWVLQKPIKTTYIWVSVLSSLSLSISILLTVGIVNSE